MNTASVMGPPVKTARGRETWSFMAELCWHALHFIIAIIAFVTSIINKLWYYLFAMGSLEKYKASQGKKPQIVGVVVESLEAKNHMPKIFELLRWLADIGVQHVSLYDMEGVLKNSKRSLEKTLNNLSAEIRFIDTWDEGKKQGRDFQHNVMTVELLSVCDGKEGIAKAARYLCSNTLQKINSDGKRADLKLTEADIDRGLRAAGCAGPEPDLLLVFGFTRCLLGFPAWRLRFTEIMASRYMNDHGHVFNSFKRGGLRISIGLGGNFTHPIQGKGSIPIVMPNNDIRQIATWECSNS